MMAICLGCVKGVLGCVGDDWMLYRRDGVAGKAREDTFPRVVGHTCCQTYPFQL